MDINQIKQVANSLSKLIDDNEKIVLSLFASKLSKASAAYPEDKTIGVMADVVARMGSNKLFITRAEIKDLYNRLHSRNTKFAELFSNELGRVQKPTETKKYSREADESGLDVIKKAYDAVVDPALAGALNVAFGGTSKFYSDTMADKAKTVCAGVCNSNLVKVVNGNEKFVICSVTYETPKGQTSVFVPVEFAANSAIIPTVFIGNNGVEEIKNIKNYIVSNAGKKLSITDKIAYQTIERVKSGANEISDVDLALSKLNATKETKAEYTASGIVFQKVATEDQNLVVKTPTFEDKEVDSFAAAFDSAKGVAAFKFGKDKIELGRNIVANKLNTLGFKGQISVFNCDDNGITYAVSLGKTAFRVPVKVEQGRLLNPTVIISNGCIEAFSQDGLEAMQNKNTDYVAAAVASPLYGMKTSELVEVVRIATAEENYTKAEDALNILSQSEDDAAYQNAFSIFTDGLGGVKKEASKCNMIVRNASSKHALCGHTGLPIHKVFQDGNGNCLPKYRQGMKDTKDGAYFMHSKIFV